MTRGSSSVKVLGSCGCGRLLAGVYAMRSGLTPRQPRRWKACRPRGPAESPASRAAAGAGPAARSSPAEAGASSAASLRTERAS